MRNGRVRFVRIRGRVVPLREKVKEGAAVLGGIGAAAAGLTLMDIGSRQSLSGRNQAALAALKAAAEKSAGGLRGATVFGRRAKLFAGQAIAGYSKLGAGLALTGLSIPLMYYAGGKALKRNNLEDKRKPLLAAGLTASMVGIGLATMKGAKPIAGKGIMRQMINYGLRK